MEYTNKKKINVSLFFIAIFLTTTSAYGAIQKLSDDELRGYIGGDICAECTGSVTCPPGFGATTCGDVKLGILGRYCDENAMYACSASSLVMNDCEFKLFSTCSRSGDCGSTTKHYCERIGNSCVATTDTTGDYCEDIEGC